MEIRGRVFSEEEEDLALGTAMEIGIKEGIASEEEKKEFESFLFGNHL